MTSEDKLYTYFITLAFILAMYTVYTARSCNQDLALVRTHKVEVEK